MERQQRCNCLLTRAVPFFLIFFFNFGAPFWARPLDFLALFISRENARIWSHFSREMRELREMHVLLLLHRLKTQSLWQTLGLGRKLKMPTKNPSAQHWEGTIYWADFHILKTKQTVQSNQGSASEKNATPMAQTPCFAPAPCFEPSHFRPCMCMELNFFNHKVCCRSC